MTLLLEVAGIEKVGEKIEGFYDDERQMWSTVANISDLNDACSFQQAASTAMTT